MMTVDEAARLLFVSRRHVRRLVVAGELLCVRDASGDILDIEPTSLNIYIYVEAGSSEA
jgi:excisionase family DNA binding protein